MSAQHHCSKKLLLLFLFLLFLINPKKVFAVWTKDPQNPIFEGTSGWWDSRDVLEPSIISGNNLYKMYYAGNNGLGWRIGYAVSSDGKTSWSKLSLPIIEAGSLDGFENDTSSPLVIYDGITFKMWYSSIRPHPYWISGPDRFRIRYATSIDGTTWTRNPSWILIGTNGLWDSGGSNRGISVLKSETNYQMWYAAVNDAAMGSPEEKWQIGYATSPDGISWTKYPDPVIQPDQGQLSVLYPNVLFDGQKYEMWYATFNQTTSQILYASSTDGIHWEKPADKNPVLTPGQPGDFDSGGLCSPFVIKQGNTYKMWYSGIDGYRWRIGYAENQILDEPTPIPTSTPTPTLTPTATPTPALLQPLILLPGLGASWNYKSIVLGINHPQSEWQMTPGLKVYDGLIQTFKNAGYLTDEPNRNLYIFNYDWSKPVNLIAQNLKDYIDHVVIPSQGVKIDLVGHSLGGLVARTYAQNNPENHVDQLLTLGSPHHGAVSAYYSWEGGDLNYFPPWQRVAVGLLLHLRNPGYATSKQAIHTIAPVIRDLLPEFNYLKQNSIEKPVREMLEKNNWLINLNSSPPPHLLSALNTFVGKITSSTLRWVMVQPRTWLDKVLNLWPDGKPTGEKEFAEGDRTILTLSGRLDDASLTELPDLNHGDLVQAISGQQKIMEVLGLNPLEISNISVGLSYEPSLVFLLASPATIEILGPDGTPIGYGDGKLILVPNPPSGNYRIGVNGTGNGGYTLHLGQFTAAGDIWSSLSGSITSGQQISHNINFQSSSPSENPFVDPNGDDFLRSARAKLSALKYNQVIRLLNKSKFELAITELYLLRFRTKSWATKNQIQSIINDLEQIYIITQANKGGFYPPEKLKKEIAVAEKLFQGMEKKLKLWNSKNRANPENGTLYLLAQKKLNQAKNSSSYEAHIKTLGAHHLSIEGLAY